MSAILESVLKEGPIGLLDKADGVTVGLFSALLDDLAHGIVLTDISGSLVHANRTAKNELALGRLVGLQDQMLTAVSADDQKTLLEAVARAAGGKRSLIRIGSEGMRLSLALLPLPGARVGVLFERPAVCDPVTLCTFARQYSLTATEEQVLGVLCEGLPTPAIAKQMNVAVSTIRSHVRSLCAKTQVRGVRGLLMRVALLPPVAPTLRPGQLH